MRKFSLNTTETPSQGVKNAFVVSLIYMCPYSIYKALPTLVVFGSVSRSSVLVRTSIGSFWYFLYFGILLTETAATSERLAHVGL